MWSVARELAVVPPVGFLDVLEHDVDLIGRGLADLHHGVGDGGGDLSLLLLRAAGEPLDRDVRHDGPLPRNSALPAAIILNPVETEYREEPCRSALNRVTGMAFRWSLNPYMGCVHRCTFCYVRAFERRADRPSDGRYGSTIRVKINVVEVLRRELA